MRKQSPCFRFMAALKKTYWGISADRIKTNKCSKLYRTGWIKSIGSQLREFVKSSLESNSLGPTPLCCPRLGLGAWNSCKIAHKLGHEASAQQGTALLVRDLCMERALSQLGASVLTMLEKVNRVVGRQLSPGKTHSLSWKHQRLPQFPVVQLSQTISLICPKQRLHF